MDRPSGVSSASEESCAAQQGHALRRRAPERLRGGAVSSLADETPEGRSISCSRKNVTTFAVVTFPHTLQTFVPFSAQTRMSGVDLDGREVRKGALEAITRLCGSRGHAIPVELQVRVREISNAGGNAATGCGEWPRAGRDRAYRYRQGRHEGAFRPSSRHGHSHHDDHG